MARDSAIDAGKGRLLNGYVGRDHLLGGIDERRPAQDAVADHVETGEAPLAQIVHPVKVEIESGLVYRGDERQRNHAATEEVEGVLARPLQRLVFEALAQRQPV